MKKRRLLFLINTLACGGAEKVLVNLLNQLDKTKYIIDLFAIEDGINAKFLDKDIQYRYILKGKKGFYYRLRKWIIYHLPKTLFSKLFIKGEYDCEIAFLEGFPTRLVADRKTSAKKIAVVHCNLTYEIVAGLYKSEKDLYQEYLNLDCVVFVSDSSRQAFEKRFGGLNNAKILYNIMNVREIELLSKQECSMHYQTEGMKLISIGRLEKVKGFDRLFDIVSRLEKTYDFELWILGEGSQRKRLENQLKEKDIHSVKLLGHQDNPYRFLKQADIYVCSSYTEGYSTVIKESLLCGIPVLATNCGGMQEIFIEGENGCLVENSEEGLERGMKRLFTDKSLLQKLKAGAVRYMVEYNKRYDIEQYEKLLEGENDV